MEIWLALYLLGEPVGPAAVLGGSLAGIGAEAALAVALVKRARDLVLGLPILAWWQLEELRGVMRRR